MRGGIEQLGESFPMAAAHPDGERGRPITLLQDLLATNGHARSPALRWRIAGCHRTSVNLNGRSGVEWLNRRPDRYRVAVQYSKEPRTVSRRLEPPGGRRHQQERWHLAVVVKAARRFAGQPLRALLLNVWVRNGLPAVLAWIVVMLSNPGLVAAVRAGHLDI